ncbi:hypothetical protein H0H87_005936 [Tephrocybe sp. NHM501043]|nr:hypothetical protein H0H87_005936 [Tephrocybe sp. NHM501043]
MSFKGTKPSERAGRHNPKTIGHIPGYPVGSTFENRAELSAAGVHAPLRAGIHGNQEDGAYSVVLSYGYEDDDDNGETLYRAHVKSRSVLYGVRLENTKNSLNMHLLKEPDQPPLPIQRYYNASAARSSRKPLKFSKITSTIAVPREKPARTPHTPLPPYRPSAIQIAKLHRKPIPHPTQLGSSRSPESSNEPLRTSPSSSSSFQLPESEKGKKKRLASLKLGAFSPEAYILAVSKSRKRLHEDIEYDSSDSDAMSGDGIGSAKRSPDERDVPSKWGTVMGKRKLPQTLNFKRMKI